MLGRQGVEGVSLGTGSSALKRADFRPVLCVKGQKNFPRVRAGHSAPDLANRRGERVACTGTVTRSLANIDEIAIDESSQSIELGLSIHHRVIP